MFQDQKNPKTLTNMILLNPTRVENFNNNSTRVLEKRTKSVKEEGESYNGAFTLDVKSVLK